MIVARSDGLARYYHPMRMNVQYRGCIVSSISLRDQLEAAAADFKAKATAYRDAQAAAAKPGLSDEQFEAATAKAMTCLRAQRTSEQALVALKGQVESAGKTTIEPLVKAVESAKRTVASGIDSLRQQTDRSKLTVEWAMANLIAPQVQLLDAQDALKAAREAIGIKVSLGSGAGAGAVARGERRAGGILHGDAAGNLRHWMGMASFEQHEATLVGLGVVEASRENGVNKRVNVSVSPSVAQAIVDGLVDDQNADGSVKTNGAITILRDRCTRFLAGEQAELTGKAAQAVA